MWEFLPHIVSASDIYLFIYLSTMTRRKNRALQVPPVVPYKALEKFPKALYGTTSGTCSVRFFLSVMDRSARHVVSIWVFRREKTGFQYTMSRLCFVGGHFFSRLLVFFLI